MVLWWYQEALHLLAVIFYLPCLGKWPTIFECLYSSIVALVPKISMQRMLMIFLIFVPVAISLHVFMTS